MNRHTDSKHPDMSPEAIDKRLRDLTQIDDALGVPD